VTGLAFHPSGKYLACGTNDKAGKPNLFFVDVESGEVLTKLAATKSGVSAICFDSKGDRVAAIGGSGTILIYDARPLLKLQKE
jgi:WD40 repeat protein